jgi:polygalacturonase
MATVMVLALGLNASYAKIEVGKLNEEIRRYVTNLPFKMSEPVLPQIPERIFNITDYGAVGDGQTMNTEAFRRTINACSNAGGGTVVVPPGLWLTGPIELKSRINFHVERGAVVLFSRDHNDYPIIKSPTRGYVVASPLYGFNLEDVAITGSGLLDGSGATWRPVKKSKVTASLWKEFVSSGGVVTDNGTMWWPSQSAANGEQYLRQLRASKDKKDLTPDDFVQARDFMRPILLFLSKCKRVLVDGITLENSPSFAMYPDRCEDVVIRDVKINNEYWAQNGDGIDIASSKNVLIYKCTVTAGDDGICMKSSRDKSDNAALQNVVIADCVVYHAHGGFVIGSNTDGGMENISVKNCDYIGTDIGLRFKSARGRGGTVKNIYVSNIYMKDIVNEAILFDTYYEQNEATAEPQPVTGLTPIFEDFHIDSIYCNGARQAVRVDGLPEMPVQDVTIADACISADRGFTSKFASGFTLKDVKILPRTGEVYSLYQTKDFNLVDAYCPPNTDTFMSVAGSGTAGVRIIHTKLSSAKTKVKYGQDVRQDAVTENDREEQ